MSLNILITGSSGFLGEKLCEILSKTKNIITALDIINPDKKFKEINYVVSSVNEYIDKNKESLETFDLIIHAASVLPYKGNKNQLIETNINTTKNLIKTVSNLKNTFFVYISSSGVYGNPLEIPVSMRTEFNPLDLYAETKITSENNLKKYLKNETYAVIRPRTILGNNRKGIFEIFFKLIKYNIPIPLPNKGRQIIQFVEVEDLARLIIHIGKNKLYGNWPAAAPSPDALKKYLNTLGSIINKNILTFNINPRLFYFIGSFLIKLRLINFTKWHFGSFPYDFYFEPKWKPVDFEYKSTCEETFLKSANTFFKS